MATADMRHDVSAFCSVSLVHRSSSSASTSRRPCITLILGASHFAVNILSAEQEAISRRFSRLDEHDRFDGLGYAPGVSGAALLDDALAHIECRRVAQHRAGDHTIVIGEVEAATAHVEQPLLYYRGGYAQIDR